MEKQENNDTLHYKHEKLSTLLFYLSILFFIIGFNFTDTPPGPFWYQQFMPNIGSRQITDVTFLDSLTGYAVTNNLSAGDTGYVLKTTSAGDNWNVNFILGKNLQKVKFINSNTGFICGGTGGGTAYLAKTTNAGSTWTSVTTPGGAMWKDMTALNKDTLWVVDDDGLVGGVFRTTNGGASWQQQPAPNMDHIYMYNRNIGFVTNTQVANYKIYKTTDSGLSWNLLNDGESFVDMYFIDSLVGWKCFNDGAMKKTSDGGLTWFNQIFPITLSTGILKFSNVNADTIWGVGGIVAYPNGQFRGIVYKTTNGGENWGYQIPDTTIHVFEYFHNKFVNRLNGWAYATRTGIHTVEGGDTSLLNIQEISNETPKAYKLFQNYPNPFNPVTKIKYQTPPVLTVGEVNVRLTIYDIQGREVTTLVNQKQRPGTYQVEFNGIMYASGVYFYSLIVDGNLVDTKKLILLK